MASELSPKIWAALGAVYVIWGSTYLAIKVVVETMPPLLTAGVRFLVAGLAMYAFGRARARSMQRPTLAHWRSAAIIGTALCLGGNGLVNLAEKRGLDSGIAALIVATVPLFLALFDRVFLQTRLPAQAVAGLIVGFAGTALLVRGPGSEGSIDTIGALEVVAASAIWAAGSLYARRATLPERPAVSTGMEMICGGIALGATGLLLGEAGDVHPSTFSRASLIGLAYLVVFGSIVGFSAYVWLIRNVRTSIAGTYAYVNPLIAVLLGWLFVDERLTGTMIVAGGIIVVAVAIIVMSARPAEPLPADERSDLGAERLPT